MAVDSLRSFWNQPAVAQPPRRTRSDWFVLAFTLLLGVGETLSTGLGWPAVRAGVAVAAAWVLLQRRRAPLLVVVVMAVITLSTSIALRIAGHYLLLTGLSFAVAIYALVRWASGRHVAVGLGVVAAHAIGGQFVDPNSSVTGTSLFYGGSVLLAYALRTRASTDQPPPVVSLAERLLHRVRRSTMIRVVAVVILLIGLLVASRGVFIVDQFASYVTRSRSPTAPDEWSVDATTLRRTAEASRGSHDSDGAIRHTVNYPYQLLAALESPTYSVEADVTVIDGTAFLQHDPKKAVGMPLLEFLEYAAIADFPIVKLDLKRDRVGPIIDEVHQAIDRFGLDPGRLQFNADVFRGPDIENDVFGARTDLSSTDAMYNLIAMELETSDLARIARRLPESTIAISAFTPTGPRQEGYSEDHLERFLWAADEIREVNPGQSLVFVVRGDLASRSGPHLLDGLTAVENSYVAAWWSTDVEPTQDEVETLVAGGVTFFDLGQEAAN